MKNIKLLNGRPLIEYTIKAAIDSKSMDRVIVSTDHDEIARISKECGAEVPFKRPDDISEDVSTELVLQHVVKYLEEEEGYAVDAVVLLQPTSPFRKSSTIKKCVDLFREKPDADSVVSVNNVEGYRTKWMLSFDEEGTTKGITGVGDAGFFGNDLLGAHGNGGGVLRGQRHGFVHTVGVQGLGAAEDGC